MRLLVIFLLSLPVFAQELETNVGIAGRDLKPAVGIPLAGYGDKQRRLKPWDWKNKYPHSFFFKPSEGVRDPIQAKTMVIERGKKRVVFISLDVIGVSDHFKEALYYRLAEHGFDYDEIFITGTHTHSGPGTLSKNLGLSMVAVDLFKKKNFEYMVEQTYQSVLSALNNLQPAQLYRSQVETFNVQRNKWREDEGWFDNKARFLLAKSKTTGWWLGGMLNYSMHGNTMNIADLRYSGDMPGELAYQAENRLANRNNMLAPQPTILFMNGAEGDVNQVGGRGEEVLVEVGNRFGEQIEPALDEQNMYELDNPVIKTKAKNMFMGMAGYQTLICARSDGWYKKWMKYIPGNLAIPAFFVGFPFFHYLTSVQVGDILMMSWPGEPSTTLGYRLQDAAAEAGFEHSWVLGLTNDYLTYFNTKEEFYEGRYDSCSNFYGWRGGKRIIRAHKKILKKFK